MAEPIISRLPEAITSFQNKYPGNYAQTLPPSIYNALTQMDAERVQRGQPVLSETNTVLASQAALQNRAITPPKDRNIVGDFLSDVNLTLRSIPKLPAAMIEELRQLPQVGDHIARANREGGNPLGNLAMAPGFRLIPGAYIAGNVLGGYDPQTGQTGSPSELLEHPLFTGLDILPFASGAAARTTIGRAARLQSLESGAKFRPIQTLATRKLDPVTGEIVPNKFSSAILTPAGGTLKRTRPGQFLSEAFGDMGRGPARLQSHQTDIAHKILAGDKDFPGDPSLVRDINDWGSKLADDGIDFDEFTSDIQRKSPADMTDSDLARNLEYRTLTDRLLKIGEDEGKLRQVIIGDSPEIYDVRTAQHISDLSRRTRVAEETVAAKEALLDPSGIDPQRIVADLREFTLDTRLTLDESRQILRGKLTVLNNAGFDVNDLLRDVRNMTKGSMQDVQTRVQSLAADPSPFFKGDTRGAMDELLHQLEPLRRSNPKVSHLFSVAKRQVDPFGVVEAVRNIRDKGYTADIDPGLIDRALTESRQWANNARYTEATKKFTSGYLNRVKEREGRFIARNPSARFQTRLEDDLQRATEAAITGKGFADLDPAVRRQAERLHQEVFIGNPNIDTYLDYARNRSYTMLADLPPQEFMALKSAVRSTWLGLKEAGFDPSFVHRVDESAAKALQYPKILERILEPSQVKKRVFDSRPYVNNAQVALTHQAYEWINRRGSEAFVDDIVNMYGVDELALRERFYAQAEKRAIRNPARDVEGHLEDIIKREYTPLDPGQFITWPGAKLSDRASRVWVPRGVRRNIERMHVPPGERVSGVLDPIMKVFRTALLPLSPRWHVYNIIGNGVMLMARTDPTVFKYFGRAREMLKAGELPESLPLGSSISPLTEWGMDWSGKAARAKAGNKAAKAEMVSAGFHMKAGMQMRQIMDALQPAKEGFGKFVQKSYDWNMRVDDMGRAMGYLYNYDKGLTKGLSKEAAQARGIALTRRIFQNWDEITPLERTIMRFVFPFYSWTSHILRYVASYPMDHPVRASIMASFARNEIEDMGTGLPERFMSLFTVGNPDIDGNIGAINLSGMNPFEDTANWFSLAGFMAGEEGNLSAVTGNLNPIFSAALQSLGIDPMKGAPELYPDLKYNPDTGRLEAANTNPILNAANAILPQSRLLTNLATGNDEWKDLLKTDPDAASRLIQSTMGLPVIYRQFNQPQEIMKAELARIEDQSEARRDALSTGNLSAMNAYPGLDVYAQMIQQMDQTGLLDQYRPEAAQAATGQPAPDTSPMNLLRQALTMQLTK